MRAWWPVLFVAGVVTLATPARAQTNKEKADALFREGRAASQTGDYATACAKFGESEALDPSIGTQLNLGDCSEHLGRWVAARTYFRDAILKLDPADPRVVAARDRLNVLETRIPRLTVSLAQSAPPGTTVKCDGKALGADEVGTPVPRDPGEHTCVAVAPGRQEKPQTVTLKESSTGELTVAPGDPIPVGPVGGDVQPLPQSGSGKRTAGFIVGGIGVASLVFAGISGVIILNEKSTADSGCPGKTNCSPDALSAISANKTWLPINMVAWIVGVAGVGTGAYLVITGKDDKPAARVGAMLLPGGAGAGASWVLE